MVVVVVELEEGIRLKGEWEGGGDGGIGRRNQT